MSNKVLWTIFGKKHIHFIFGGQKMKRILKVFVLLSLAVLLVFNTTACNNIFGQPTSNESTNTDETTTTITPEETTPEEVTPEESTPDETTPEEVTNTEEETTP